MKRILVLLMALTLMLMMTACGDEVDEPTGSSSNYASSELFFEDENDDTTKTNSTEVSSNDASDDGWRDFLKEYEEWVDKYIAVIKKYKSNPSDMSILTEYTSLVTELAEWTEKADGLSDSIVDAEDAAEYPAELMRIAAKIADAAGEL